VTDPSTTPRPSKKFDVDLYTWSVHLDGGGWIEGGVGYDDEGHLGHDIAVAHQCAPMTVEEAQKVAELVLTAAQVYAAEVGGTETVHDVFARGVARLAEGEALAAGLDLGPCPSWCVGAEHPSHDTFDPSPDGQGGWIFAGFHESEPITVPVKDLPNPRSWPRVVVQQFETRHLDGRSELDETQLAILGEPTGVGLTESEARQFAEALSIVATQLSEIAVGGVR
jgi:hypothetical protein